MSSIITKGEFYTLCGLRAMSDEANRSLDHMTEAVQKITGDCEDGGHSQDFVYCPEISVMELLKKLGITVEDGE